MDRGAGQSARQSTLYCRLEGSNSRLRLACWKEGDANEFHATGAVDQGVTPLVSDVARQIAPQSKAPPVTDQALAAFAARDWERAVELSPEFALAYTEGAEAAQAAGEPDRARKIAALGLARASLPQQSRHRLEYVQALLGGNQEAQLEALRKLNLAAASDPEKLREQAALELARREYAKAAETMARLVAVQPAQPALLNQLLYFRGYAGDLEGARKTAADYAAILPNHPDPGDSLGEVLFHNKRFADAARQFAETYQKHPEAFNGGEAFKAAIAFLYARDAAAAEQQHKLWAAAGGAREGDWTRAVWLFYNGRPEEAEKAGAAAAARLPGPQAVLPFSHLSIWALLRGDTALAASRARQAMTAAQTTGVPGPLRLQAAIAYFLSQPPAGAAEWTARGERMFAGPPAKQLRTALTAFALLATRRAAEAEPLARQALAGANPQSEFQARALVNWSLAEQKKPDAKLLATAPMPPVLTAGVLETVLIAEDLRLRRQ